MPIPSIPANPLKAAAYGYIQPTDMSTLAGYAVVATLVSYDGFDGQFMLDDLIAIPKTHSTTTDSAGLWAFELYGNDHISASGSSWLFTITGQQFSKSVELSAGTVVNVATVVEPEVDPGSGLNPPANYVIVPGGDPNADRIVFWDNSANGYRFLTVGSGLAIADKTMTAAGGGGSGLTVGTTTITGGTTGRGLYNNAGVVGEIGGFRVVDVSDFLASGSTVVTTGSISSGTASLVVASTSTFAIGQGVLVRTAGAAGAHLVSIILGISGTTITLANNAGSTVSGVVVQHDDSAAINAACDAVYAAGGGIVFLRDGLYRCNGPLRSDTNSIIGFPSASSDHYVEEAKWCMLLGESKGSLDAAGRGYSGGVVIDATNGPTSGDLLFSVVAAAKYEAVAFNYGTGANLRDIFFSIDRMLILAISNPAIGGVNCSNAVGCNIGDNLAVFAQWENTGVPRYTGWGTYGPVLPNSGGRGIHLPQSLNNKRVICGAVQVMGFEDGIVVHEHAVLRHPQIAYCNRGLTFVTTGGHINRGTVSIENCIYDVVAISGPCVVDIEVDIEIASSGYTNPAAWWFSTTNLHSVASGSLVGRITYFVIPAGGVAQPITKDSMPLLTTINLANKTEDNVAMTGATINGNTITTGTGTLTLSTFTLTASGTASVSGNNTGDQTLSGLVAGLPTSDPLVSGSPWNNGGVLCISTGP